MSAFLAAWSARCGQPDRAFNAALASAGPDADVLVVAAGSLGTARGRPALRLGPLAMCGAVRLDDRAELVTALGLRNAGTDAELVLRAWADRGDACLDALVGAFAFVVWDARRRRLTAVRDHLGLQPLFWATLATGDLLLASTPAPLLAHPAVDATMDDRAVAAACLNDYGYLLGRTLHRGVRTVSPGSLLRLDGGRVGVRRYWHPPTAAPRRTPAEWADGLAHRLEIAVAAAVADDGPFGAHLSGGLDSSAVTAVAQRQLRRRGSQLRGVWSWSPPGTAAAAQRPDERARIKLLAGRLGVPVHYTDLTVEDMRASMLDALAPESIAGLFHERLVIAGAAQQGVRVLLSGWGGDEFASYNGRAALAGALRSGRPLLAVGGAYRRAGRASGARRAAATAIGVSTAARQLLPSRWRAPSHVERIVERMARFGVRPEDVHPEGRRALAASDGPAAGSAADMLASLQRGHLSHRLEAWWHAGQRYGLEYRYPLLDRRVVEYALQVPDEVHLRGRPRWLFRTVADAVLPAGLAWGDVKGEAAKQARQSELLTSTPPLTPDGPPEAAAVAQAWFSARRALYAAGLRP